MQSHTHTGIIYGEAGGQGKKQQMERGNGGQTEFMFIIHGSQTGSAGIQATTTQTVQKQNDAKNLCVPFSYSSNHLLCCCDLFKLKE